MKASWLETILQFVNSGRPGAFNVIFLLIVMQTRLKPNGQTVQLKFNWENCTLHLGKKSCFKVLRNYQVYALWMAPLNQVKIYALTRRKNKLLFSNRVSFSLLMKMLLFLFVLNLLFDFSNWVLGHKQTTGCYLLI